MATLVIKVRGKPPAASELAKLLKRAGVSASVSAVEESSPYMFASVESGDVTDELLTRIRELPGVEAAYLKPPETLP